MTSSPSDKPVLDLLAAQYPDSSKSTLRKWIEGGRVFVDGMTVKSAKQIVKEGETLTVGQKVKRIDNQIPIIYSDDDIIVIDKPSGLLSVSTAFDKENTAFAHLKKAYYPKPVYVVHRLDQDTSGVMVFALSERALTALKITFEKHDIERRYAAIVEGKFFTNKGTWQSYLYEDSNYVVKVVDDATKGELATTHYEVKACTNAFTWLELTLETGKKNQIRVHCQHAGHPIVGDKKYGSSCNPFKRLGLHAHCLNFSHPVTGKKMHFTSPIPEAFLSVIKKKERKKCGPGDKQSKV